MTQRIGPMMGSSMLPPQMSGQPQSSMGGPGSMDRRMISSSGQSGYSDIRPSGVHHPVAPISPHLSTPSSVLQSVQGRGNQGSTYSQPQDMQHMGSMGKSLPPSSSSGRLPSASTDQYDIESLFRNFEGFIDARIFRDKNKDKIAFVDFESQSSAARVIKEMNGFRLPNHDRGLTIRFSQNSRGGVPAQKPARSSDPPPKTNFSASGPQWNQPPKHTSSGYPDVKPEIHPSGGIGSLHRSSVNPVMAPPPREGTGSQAIVQELLSNPSLITNLLSNVGKPMPPEQVPIQRPEMMRSHPPRPGQPPPPNDISTNLLKFANIFQPKLLPIPPNAMNTVYVQGLPADASERQVSHLFRPFPGFKSVRLVKRDRTHDTVVFCFADFENALQATMVINTLQGYRFDRDDILGLHFSYANRSGQQNSGYQSRNSGDRSFRDRYQHDRHHPYSPRNDISSRRDYDSRPHDDRETNFDRKTFHKN